MLVCCWIRHEFVTKPEIQSEVGSSFPIVLEVSVDIRLAKITVTIALVRQRPEKQERRSAEKTRKTVEHELSAQPAWRVHVRLHACNIGSEPDAVRAVSPVNVVTASEFVLYEEKRQEDAGTQRAK